MITRWITWFVTTSIVVDGAIGSAGWHVLVISLNRPHIRNLAPCLCYGGCSCSYAAKLNSEHDSLFEANQSIASTDAHCSICRHFTNSLLSSLFSTSSIESYLAEQLIITVLSLHGWQNGRSNLPRGPPRIARHCKFNSPCFV